MLKNIDYKQSLFYLGPSSKTPETPKWPRAWLETRDGRGVSRLRRSSLARECTPHTKSEEKERSVAVYEEYENGLKWVFENLLA